MSASDHVSGEQLRMFMPAYELHGMQSVDVPQHPGSRFGGAYGDLKTMWARKRADNRKDGLTKSVKEQGVHRPVELAYSSDFVGAAISDGHHRIQAAFDTDPSQLVPVEHADMDVRFGRGVTEPRPIPGWEEKPRFRSYP